MNIQFQTYHIILILCGGQDTYLGKTPLRILGLVNAIPLGETWISSSIFYFIVKLITVSWYHEYVLSE